MRRTRNRARGHADRGSVGGIGRDVQVEVEELGNAAQDHDGRCGQVDDAADEEDIRLAVCDCAQGVERAAG